MGKTTSLFYRYRKQVYKSGASDVTLKELNHRIAKKVHGFLLAQRGITRQREPPDLFRSPDFFINMCFK